MNYEQDYRQLVKKILDTGELRDGRNGKTLTIFGETLKVDLSDTNEFPLLTGRKIFYKGVLGELAAMLRGPKTLEDFKKFGCNYWDLWAKQDGTINVDYGNSWIDFNGIDQLERLRDSLMNDPRGRRHLVTGWRPDNLWTLDLPCCHYAYQFYIRDGVYVDMLWHQRSCDTMIGLPSDVIFATAWLIIIANDLGYVPGVITMTLGDTHIYEEHIDQAKEYLKTLMSDTPTYVFSDPMLMYRDFREFEPSWLVIENYNPVTTMKFELKA